MRRVREVIVVEGRYDKNALSQVVDAVILETAGFGIFKDAQKQKLLRTLSETRGLIVLTDPDGAGFVIRNFLKGCVDPALVKHAYVPDIPGKERRKNAPSKSPSLIFRMKSGMEMLTGQPDTQGRFLQLRQRWASAMAVSAS